MQRFSHPHHHFSTSIISLNRFDFQSLPFRNTMFRLSPHAYLYIISILFFPHIMYIYARMCIVCAYIHTKCLRAHACIWVGLVLIYLLHVVSFLYWYVDCLNNHLLMVKLVDVCRSYFDLDIIQRFTTWYKISFDMSNE